MTDLIWKKKVIEPEVELPERDKLVLDKYNRRVKRFDEVVKICCCWVGYDLLLGSYLKRTMFLDKSKYTVFITLYFL